MKGAHHTTSSRKRAKVRLRRRRRGCKAATTIVGVLPGDLVVVIVDLLDHRALAGAHRRPPHCQSYSRGLVAATSPEPITDLLSLRATCKAMHAAAKERDVGRRVPLERLDGMKWLENQRYLAIVDHLVGAGNPDACFIVGVTLVFARQDMEQGLLFLDKAAAAGHKAAAYVLGLLLYKSGEARAVGKKYISQVEGDDGGEAAADARARRTNRECQRCRKIAEDAVREVMWKVAGRRGRALVMPEDGHRCTSAGCGVESGWVGYGVFCSDGCRIRHEYSKFFTEVMNYLP